MATDTPQRIAAAYRWHRRLGHAGIDAPHCHIVANPAWPQVWDANHVDAVTARTPAEIDGVLAAMDRHLAHTPWRVAHTDGFTPDEFLARLALDGFEERPVTLQMVLEGGLTDRGCVIDLHPVETDADWSALQTLVVEDVAEGRKTGDLDLSAAFAADMVATYRAKAPDCRYHLVMQDGQPVAYGALAAAPDGVGLIEDLFTRAQHRRQGIATGLIAAFADRLRDRGCDTVFLGALATEAPKHLYARLGFRPVGLARTWIRDLSAEA
jgi:GNAT superfamily N-acetyltransferase